MVGTEVSLRIRREIRDGKFQVATTIILCLSVAFIVLVLGMIINDHLKRFMVYEDLSASSLNAFPPRVFPSPTRQTTLQEWILPSEVWHSMSDEEVMWRASMAPRIMEPPFNRTPKIAFMFLTRGRLPLAPLWEMFFEGNEGLFSIYLHTPPDSTYQPSESSLFYKRTIPSKSPSSPLSLSLFSLSKVIQKNLDELVQWGKSSMIDAERRLLANALLDFSNERFVLLSESCIPIFNFSTVYNYLINSNQSFLSAFDDPRPIGRGRYNRRMGPTIALRDWRKGSQWFEANRELALAIVSDVTYYPIFRNFCAPPCYMDEHYFPTLVTKVCPNLTSNQTVTWTDWSGGGSHPTMFKANDVSEGFLNRVRLGSNCTYNGEVSSVCYLFARKFHPNTLQPLLRIAPKLLGFHS
ncbi:glycosyltransferase BC10-like [Salvia miltiorrhiza]|uniref:glycosyltransferase BC10-like n=1 Tax=Salvia miltiorrhiza TaxID=226208 RepID=UPI0025AD4496|nr:glycosyltransferase BC10-like [Salvia miltiorrhiza]